MKIVKHPKPRSWDTIEVTRYKEHLDPGRPLALALSFVHPVRRGQQRYPTIILMPLETARELAQAILEETKP